MRNVCKFVALFLVVLVLVAQTQVATATSDSAFLLRGANVTPGQGVPSWPVLPGDILKAGPTTVTITFPDGSIVTLAPGASAKVDLSGQTPVFQLLNGSAHYALKDSTAVKLMTGANPYSVTNLIGDLQVGGKTPPAGWWTAGHTTAVVVAGAAGATALGVAASKGKGPPVSPSVCNNGNGKGNGEPACN